MPAARLARLADQLNDLLEPSDNDIFCLPAVGARGYTATMEPLRALGELMVGATPGLARSDTRLVKYVRAGDITETGVAPPADGPEPTRGQAAQLVPGDIIVRGRGAPLAAIVPPNAVGAYATNDVLLFRADLSKADPQYIATFINLPHVRAILAAGSQGAALSRLSVQKLGSVDIPLPPLETQRKIAAVADCARTEQNILSRLSALRAQLHQRILQQLLGSEGGSQPPSYE